MRRYLLALSVLAACGGAGNGDAPPGSSTTVETAPDFTLELGDGGTFTLAQEKRPVYLLFWAEW